jgi:DNA-binding CsgD family transcriptional regulator
MRTHELNAQAMFAEILFWQGEWSAAEDAAGDVLDSSPHTAMIGWRVLGNIQARRGQPGAGSALQQVWAMAVASDELQTLDPAATVLAEYAWLSRESEPELVNRLRDVYEMGLRRGVPWPSGALCFWLWKLGVVDSVPETTSVFYRWIIEGEWRRAAEFWNDRGAPYDEALALMHGDEDAQRRAVRIFEDLEADAAANRLRRDLAAAGTIVPRGAARSTRRHVAGLTARQAQILELLAEGLSNPEIADRLFLSPRTVENHVAGILLKLDASGRVEAVAIARQRGILATA